MESEYMDVTAATKDGTLRYKVLPTGAILISDGTLLIGFRPATRDEAAILVRGLMTAGAWIAEEYGLEVRRAASKS